MSNNNIEAILAKISIADVISSRISLKKKGREFEACCPFHHEKTPSFTISVEKGFYHCFGCGAHGNAIGFIMEFEKISFREALEKIAKENGIILPKFRKRPQIEVDLELRRLQILEKIQQFFSQNLKHYRNISALNYLQDRGVDDGQIAEFQIGFAPNDFNLLVEFLEKNNFSMAEMLETSIIGKNIKGNLYSKFRNRIIFPIANKHSQTIAFGGRRLNEEDNPKYLNSSETAVFKKGQNLYNQATARKAARDSDNIIVVEGYMDVIALAKHNIKNVVAPLGTAITADQLGLLRTFSDKITFCLDGDNAGIRAMKRVIDIILPILDEKKLFVFAFLPEGLDPDDFVKKYGREAMLSALQEAKNLSQLLFELECADVGFKEGGDISPEIKAKLEANLIKKLEKIANVQVKRHFQSFYKDKLFFLGKKLFSKNKQGNKEANKAVLGGLYRVCNDNNLVNLGKEILFLLYKFPELFDFETEFFAVKDFIFADDNLDNMKEYLFIKRNEGLKVDYNDFVDSFCQNSLFSEINPLLKKDVSYDEAVARVRLEILMLKIFLHKSEDQFQNMLNNIGNEADFQEKQEGFFDYKSQISHKIINLESQLI